MTNSELDADKVAEALARRAEEGDTEALKTLMEFNKARRYENLLKGLDDDESADTSATDQFRLN